MNAEVQCSDTILMATHIPFEGKEDFPEISTISFHSSMSKYVGESLRATENRGRRPAAWRGPEMR